MLNRAYMIISLIGILLFVGCAAQQLKSYETSGFLKDYSQFKPGEEGQPNLVYLNPNRDLKTYNKILINHVVVYFNPDSENKGIDPLQLSELTQHFHQALVDALPINSRHLPRCTFKQR